MLSQRADRQGQSEEGSIRSLASRTQMDQFNRTRARDADDMWSMGSKRQRVDGSGNWKRLAYTQVLAQKRYPAFYVDCTLLYLPGLILQAFLAQ